MSGTVHVVARAGADDPHTLAVLALAEALGAAAPDAVFAAAGAPEDVRPIAELGSSEPALVVYHPRGAAPALVNQLVAQRGPMAVVHDGSPLDALALRDLRALAAAGATGLAWSAAGAGRLDEIGFARVARVPPVVAQARLAAVDAYAPTDHHLDIALHGPLILTVDEVATAENGARVLQGYHVLRTYLARAGHLAIAVPETPETDETALRVLYREVWGLRLTDAWAHRLVHLGERAALTRRAAVFVTADPAGGDVRHALAAMAEGVPVVAPADASAREVLAGGAVLLPSDAGAALFAEAVSDLVHDEARRAAVARTGASMIARYSPERVAPMWRSALAA